MKPLCFAERHVGDIYGRWTVLGRGDKPNYVKCRCGCGVEADVYVSSLRSGNSTSCGCYRSELQARLHTTHGESDRFYKTKEYYAWANMKTRCYNPKSSDYPDYGGRGIAVCEDWNLSYEKFLAHVGRAPSRVHSLDRINVNGDYTPGNVRWATPVQQARNRR